MKSSIFVLACLISVPSFGMESVVEFHEQFSDTSCSRATALAAERAAKQMESGSDVYDGDIRAYKGKKIIRFVQSVTPCEAVFSDFQGMIFNYYLGVQVDAK